MSFCSLCFSTIIFVSFSPMRRWSGYRAMSFDGILLCAGHGQAHTIFARLALFFNTIYEVCRRSRDSTGCTTPDLNTCWPEGVDMRSTLFNNFWGGGCLTRENAATHKHEQTQEANHKITTFSGCVYEENVCFSISDFAIASFNSFWLFR